MMDTEWPPMKNTGAKVDESRIAAFEKHLGQDLPDDYRRFIAEVNGGYTHENHCKFSRGVLNTLFTLDDEDEASNLQVRSDRERKHLPHKDLLFVGHDGTGGAVLLMLSGDHRGEVWHRGGSDSRPPGSDPRVLWHDRRDMSKVADNWKDFMRSLKALP
jgi:hypothetical protein